MKYVLAIFSFIIIVMFILGWYAQRSGQSQDEKVGSAFFYLVGIAFLILLAVFAIVHAVWETL